MSVECPACQSVIADDATYCEYCGAEFAHEEGDGAYDAGGESSEAIEEAEVAAEETGDRFDKLFRLNAHSELNSEPLPEVGPYKNPATLTLYFDHQPVFEYDIDADETLIGRTREGSDIQPDLDLVELDLNGVLASRHCCIFRQNKNYTLYALSNAGTQHNDQFLSLGDSRQLKDKDIIVLGGVLAMQFELHPDG